VVLLYDQLIQDLSQAARALEQNDIELRTRMINHAILVIAHLQSPLDFEKGGEVATNLDHFYNVLRQNLMAVQFKPTRQGIQQQITDVQALREAWIEVDLAEKSEIAAPASRSTHAAEPKAEDRPRGNWEG
jgi:flagellar protein FliS